MNYKQTEMQIGKNGLTSGIIDWLRNAFKTHTVIKVAVLKSSGRDKEKVRVIAERVVDELGKNYTYRIVGFTITVRKWRREKTRK